MTTYTKTFKIHKTFDKVKDIQGGLITMMKKRFKKQGHSQEIVNKKESDYIRFKLDAIKILL